MNMKKLIWKTEKRKVKELIKLDINPRKISDEKRQQLIRSLEKFNLVEIPAINIDNVLITGNQRLSIMTLVGRENEEIDVRVPNRKLTKKEVKEYSLIGNTHSGEWDIDILNEHFEDIKAENWKFDIPDFDLVLDEKIIPESEEPKEKEYDPSEKWFLNIRCDNEEHCRKLYESFKEEGLDVKIIT